MREPTLFLFNIPDEGGFKKAILFPVLVSGRKVILATCAHTVNHFANQYEISLLDGNGEPVRFKPASDGSIRTMLLPPKFATDLAFVEVEMERMPSVVKFATDSIEDDSTLFHARNVIGREEFRGKASIVTEQEGSLLPRRYAYIDGTYAEFSDLIADGMRSMPCPQRAISIRSWPGVSGSPLWNDSGRVVGMVCGGNEQVTEKEPAFFLIYLPAEVIKKSLTFLPK